jgi:hypothetical protein
LHVYNISFKYLSHLFLEELSQYIHLLSTLGLVSDGKRKLKHFIYFLTSYVFVLTSDDTQSIKLNYKKNYFLCLQRSDEYDI